MPVVHSLYRESGKTLVDFNRCSACGQCVETCPAKVLDLAGGEVRQVDEGFGCIACGHCMMVCPEECIEVRGRGIAMADLMPLPPKESRASLEALRNTMRSRRSVRRFADREVSPDQLERVVDMAATGPMGIPPWDVGVATVAGFAAVQELAAEIIDGYRRMLKVMRPGLLGLLGPFIGQVRKERFSEFIVPMAEMFIKHIDEGRDTLFWGAPAVLLFHRSAYAEEADATIACTYAMLAAEAAGLGSCIIGSAAPVLERKRDLCRRLGIPDGNQPSIALVLGYPAVPFKRTIRRRFTHQV